MEEGCISIPQDLESRIKYANMALFDTYQCIDDFVNDKQLEISRSTFAIMRPIYNDTQSGYKHAVIRFNAQYSLKYYALPSDIGRYLVKLYKNNQLYYDKDLGFVEEEYVRAGTDELCQIISKLDYVLVKLPKKKIVHTEPVTEELYRDPHGKEEVGTYTTKTYTSYSSYGGFNLVHWWKNIQSNYADIA